MKADVGDWLVARTNTTERHARRGKILAVGVDGAPPYSVHWLDDDREVLLFPGPDAEIVTTTRLAELDRLQNDRITAMQSSILHSDHPTARG